mmetsp:Transcript_2338/g.6174  ORF Transcript_2338/g.6174 Transcript_2338/m.6174 type:complete len:554 (-) Transcript_2338:29-1690(-)
MTMGRCEEKETARARGRSPERKIHATNGSNGQRVSRVQSELNDDSSRSHSPSDDEQDRSRNLWNTNMILLSVLTVILAILVARFKIQLSEYWEELENLSFNERIPAKEQKRMPVVTSVVPSDYTSADEPTVFEVSIVEKNCHLSDDGCSKLDASRLITEEMKSSYQRDGVIAIRGLVPAELSSSLDTDASNLIKNENGKNGGTTRQTGSRKGQFHTAKMGALFLELRKGSKKANDVKSEAVQPQLIPSAFRDVALRSAIPQVAAELMGLSENDETNMRMLRDVFIAKDDGEYCCGWHVDDYGYWPANPSSDGINAWIALDDMPIEKGGGFALAAGSHSADWRMDAHRAVGATTTYPPEGFQNAADMFENRTGAGTCNIATAAPEIFSRMEESKRIYNIRAGDVIFHTRWLFHRTVPFERNVVQHWLGKYRDYRGGHEAAPPSPLLHRRYSVRYAPGTAELPRGYGTELSILSDTNNAGKSLDDVVRSDGPWYPQCWPSVNSQEMKQLAELMNKKLPKAIARQKERVKEMRPFLDTIARERQTPGRIKPFTAIN